MSYAWIDQAVEGWADNYQLFEISTDTITREEMSYQKLFHNSFVAEIGGIREDIIEGAIYLWSFRDQK
jgi:hypothetical protein